MSNMKKEFEKLKFSVKRTWAFLKEDSWSSFFVNLALAFLIIKFVFFPLASFITGSSMPLVIVESCSMYHSSNFEEILKNPIYSNFNISYTDTLNWRFKSGLSKGDIIVVFNPKDIKIGDVIIFRSGSKNPIIHRVISLNPIQTKGDHNSAQLSSITNNIGIDETNISEEQLVGKAVFRIPMLGWVKLIFFEFMRQPNERGLCN